MEKLNKMELNVGTQGGDGEDCEIYGGEYAEVDIDLMNQQNQAYSHQSITSKVTSNQNPDKDLIQDPINFHYSHSRFAAVSQQEIEHRNALKKSR